MMTITRFPSISIEVARQKGYDCGLYGPNINNCHFSIFDSIENMLAYEEGKQAGLLERQKHNGFKINTNFNSVKRG